MKWIEGSRFLITGATSGIGLSFLKNILQYKPSSIFITGYKTILPSIVNDPGCKIEYRIFDLSDNAVIKSNEFRQFIEDSKPNYLIHCAGDVLKRSSLEQSDFELYEKSMNLNYHSAHHIVRIISKSDILPFLKSCVFISSISVRLPNSKDSLHYASSKSALETFVKGIAYELPPTRFNCIAPSAISTRFQELHSSEDRVSRIINQTPLKRLGDVDEVVNLIIFLLSDKASYITGSIYPITGGR